LNDELNQKKEQLEDLLRGQVSQVWSSERTSFTGMIFWEDKVKLVLSEDLTCETCPLRRSYLWNLSSQKIIPVKLVLSEDLTCETCPLRRSYLWNLSSQKILPVKLVLSEDLTCETCPLSQVRSSERTSFTGKIFWEDKFHRYFDFQFFFYLFIWII
jgi:hypothetical protein